ncbi:MAG: hypothetical protein JW861_14340 [Bacteroidales bacterium]|nr:hypothetical protein [Bacteroidales bacterium]
MTEIHSHGELESKLPGKGKAYLLLVRRGSELSECALNNLAEVTGSGKEPDILLADVNHVRDIHERYGVTSVPTMLEFEDGKFVNTLKGCHEPGFYKSWFGKAIYTATATGIEQKSVTVYTTPSCSWCNTLKQHLRVHGIYFREVDVSRDQSAAETMQRRSGQMGVPQADIGGEIVVGFDKTRINRLLGIGPQ